MLTIHEDAVAWLVDCFPDDEDEILTLSNAGVERAVQRYYEGGWAAFQFTYELMLNAEDGVDDAHGRYCHC